LIKRANYHKPTFDGLASTLVDWNGIPVGKVAGVDNFALGICADERYEETECDTRDVIVLRIPIKDGDGDNADDVNNIGDESGRCDNSDDWPVVVDDDDDDDDAKYDVCIGGGGGDVTDENDDETVGVGGA